MIQYVHRLVSNFVYSLVLGIYGYQSLLYFLKTATCYEQKHIWCDQSLSVKKTNKYLKRKIESWLISLCGFVDI